MGQRITLTDDLTGKDIPDGKGGTVQFALDGYTYEIDLHDRTAGQLRTALAPFVDVARRMSANGGKSRKPLPQNKVSHDDNAKVRAWAKENGYEVSERGRIPKEIRALYKNRDES
jgi:hypothetical protein